MTSVPAPVATRRAHAGGTAIPQFHGVKQCTYGARQLQNVFSAAMGNGFSDAAGSGKGLAKKPSGNGPHYAGHRKRLRARFLNAGAEALHDYELLELVLFRAIPQRDCKPLAKELISRFGSFAEVISAPKERLAEVPGVGEAVITELKVVQAAALRLSQQKVREKTVFRGWSDLLDYCRAAMAYSPREEFRVLFLDNRNRLIADEVQQRGTVNHTPVYPREVVRRALELAASSIILVHNHPSGDPTPSRADIEMTRQIVEAADSLGIRVHDHIIIARDGHASLRGLNLI